jgi:class 3 adenylate cyclase
MTQSLEASLEAAAARSGCDADTLSRFAGHLQSLAALQAARINPYAFAEEAGIDAEQALDLFVHGAKLGVFDLEWGMICPLCGAITHSAAQLDQVAEDSLHCSLCSKDVPSVMDDTVEVSFAYTPAGESFDLHNLHRDFATYHNFFTSSSYPFIREFRAFNERNTIGDIKLDSGQKGTLPLNLQAGETYRIVCLDTHAGADIQVEDGAANAGELALAADGFSDAGVPLAAGSSTLTLSNQTEQPVWIRVLRVVMEEVAGIMDQGLPVFGKRLTGKDLINNQAFRDCFALNELAPDLKLKLRSLTLLFTDLKGSTALYDREGDLAAYRLVQDHFAALKQVVRSHSGAVIKTMGDAVMAAFPSGNDGIAAAIAMMAAMQELAGDRDDDVGLKVGLHAGPALAINAGQALDYFGQTVNIAARVQGLADAGEICLTSALNDSESAADQLLRSGYRGHAEMARLKGVSGEEQIYRYTALSA